LARRPEDPKCLFKVLEVSQKEKSKQLMTREKPGEDN
jgi:hypothetical protein